VKINHWIFGLFIVGIIFIIGCSPEEIVEEPPQEPAESTTLAVPAPDVDNPFEVEEMIVIEEPEEPYIPEQRDEKEQKKTREQSLPLPVFTAHITDLEKVHRIVPPGSQSVDTFAEHSYIHLLPKVGRVEVYAPIDSELISLFNTGGEDGVSLTFKVDDNIFYYFDHLKEPSDKIIEMTAEWSVDSNGFTYPGPESEPVPVDVGEQVGVVIGTSKSGIWDFGVYDLTQRNNVANLDRYDEYSFRRRYLTGLCPYDFYPEDMKNDYLVLFGGAGGSLVPGSTCRGPSRDVVGTAAGNWFLDSGSDETYGPQLVIASTLAGNVRWGGVGPFTTNHDSKDGQSLTAPEDVTVGQSACYFDEYSGTNHLSIKLLSETELGVFYGQGNCPSSFPASGYKVYVR